MTDTRNKVSIGPIASSHALVQALSAIDISVPMRTEGRSTYHTERWSICRLLATLDANGKLIFPLELEHSDRPDFRVVQGGLTMGIEVTEAIPEQYAAYCALAEREFPDPILEPAHFKWDAPKLTTDEMRVLLRQDQLSGEPWVGDQPEREWAAQMKRTVDTKSATMQKLGFSCFEKNCLLIYDNLPLPGLDLGKATELLRSELDAQADAAIKFDTIYVEHGGQVVEFSKLGAQSMNVRDLWSDT